MLIVALQDDVDSLFAIYDTVTDRFIGVNLNEDCAIALIRNNKNCSREYEESRVKHPQPFSDIAKAIDVYDEDEAIHFLEVEIRQSKDRKNKGPFFDGVDVGIAKANQLLDRHIRFCKQIIDILKK